MDLASVKDTTLLYSEKRGITSFALFVTLGTKIKFGGYGDMAWGLDLNAKQTFGSARAGHTISRVGLLMGF